MNFQNARHLQVYYMGHVLSWTLNSRSDENLTEIHTDTKIAPFWNDWFGRTGEFLFYCTTEIWISKIYSAVISTTLFSLFYANYGIHPETIPIEVLSSKNPTANSFLDSIHEFNKVAYDCIIHQNQKMAEYASKSRIPHRF